MPLLERHKVVMNGENSGARQAPDTVLKHSRSPVGGESGAETWELCAFVEFGHDEFAVAERFRGSRATVTGTDHHPMAKPATGLGS